MTTRTSEFGRPLRPTRSRLTATRFQPIGGWTDEPDVLASPSSIVSGQNVWIRERRLEPRFRLQRFANNPFADDPTGSFLYNDVDGVAVPVAGSAQTVAYLNDDSWETLAYVSRSSNFPPTGGEFDDLHGVSAYLPRKDLNLGLLTNGNDPVYAWGGPSDGTGFSVLTQGPICKDLALMDSRVLAWNLRELSSSSRAVTAVAWSVAGDPEDWTGIGAGREDLVDMRGHGTRIFTDGSDIFLFSDRQIYRGRSVAAPTYFAFSPLVRDQGLPWPRAAIQTEAGIFWLGDGYHVHRLASGQLDGAVGDAIARTLQSELQDPDRAFFSYSPDHQRLTLYYSVANGAAPTRGFALDLPSGRWTPQQFSFGVAQHAVLRTVSSSASTWGGLAGTLADQTQSWADQQSLGDLRVEGLLSSDGTTTYYDASAGSDDGQTVLSEAVFGGLFTGDPFSLKFVDQARLDVRADSASSLSFAVSGNLGGAFANEQEFAVSVQSNTSQRRLSMGVPGEYHAVRVRSDEGRWQLMSVTARARVLGESV